MTCSASRMHGHQTYAAFPKLLLIGLTAVTPALLNTAVRVFAWEDAYVGAQDLGPAVGVILPICCLGLVLMLYLACHSALGCAFEHPGEARVQQVRSNTRTRDGLCVDV